VFRRIIRICAGLAVSVAVAGAAVAAPGSHFGGARGGGGAFGGSSSRGGRGSLSGSPAPSARPRNVPRGGPGTLGQFYGRSPSTPRSSRSYPYYLVPYNPYYDGFYGSPFYYDPFFYNGFYPDYGNQAYGGFYPDYGNQSYGPGYSSPEEWSKRGNVELHVDPKDVEVIVDGIPSAHSGRAVLNLPTGLHHFEIVHPGYRPWVVDLDIKQGVRYRLDQRLERLPKEEQESGADRPPSSRAGELRLKVQPTDTIVNMDGRLLGMVDLLRGSQALHRIPPGTHTLRFSHPGYKTVEKEIEVTPDHPTEVSVDLERE
jgi:hypothetical protein